MTLKCNIIGNLIRNTQDFNYLNGSINYYKSYLIKFEPSFDGVIINEFIPSTSELAMEFTALTLACTLKSCIHEYS